MGSFIKNTARMGGWLALVYFGYWLALLLDDLFIRAAIYPLLGAPVLDWRLTAFRATVTTADPAGLPLSQWLRTALPLIFSGGFLVVLLGCGHRLRIGAVRILVHNAGFWAALLLAAQAAAFAYSGRGRFASLFSAFFSGHMPAGVRITVSLLFLVLFLWVAAICVARLVPAFANLAYPQNTSRWLFLVVLVASVVFILAGTFGFRIRFLGTRWIFFFLVPGALSLLLGILGLRRHDRISGSASATEGPSLGTFTAVASAAIALTVGFGFSRATQVEAMLFEQKLAQVRTVHYEIRYDPQHFEVARVRALAEERERILERLASRLRVADDSLRSLTVDEVSIRLILYPDFPSKRAATSSDLPYNVDGTTVRALLFGYLKEVDPAADATALLHSLWGPPGNLLLETWIARLLAGDWHGRTIEEAVAQIESQVGHYTVSDLLAATPDQFLSPLVREPAGAAWIAQVYQKRGLESVRRLYSLPGSPLSPEAVGEALGSSVENLESEWQATTQRLLAQHPPAEKAPRPLPTEFWRGVTFSHEGFGGRRGGYVDPMAAEQLRAIRSTGANAIAVVPYGLMRDASVPVISTDFTDETDQELTQALYVAHGLGLKVMLKPQIWVSRGIFTGQVRFEEPEARNAWMRAYREFILHYARLAEMEGFDLLCIGNELGGMTVHDADWRRILADVRRVYHGPITYAANWGTEFETLRFWDALDYVGLNNYYPLTRPLSERAAAASGDPLVGAHEIAAKLDSFYVRWKKPILFTEVGYPSIRGGTAEPWIEDASRGVSSSEQAAGYSAVFETYAHRPWLRGMFWWKWPSNGREAGLQDPSFSLLGKPAETVLRTWYTRMANGGIGQPAAAP